MSTNNDPDFECAAYQEQMKDWEIVDDCFNGERDVKDKNEEYLPQHEKETNKAYSIRLNRSSFWNAYKRTVQGLVGMVFRKNPQLGDDVPARIKVQAEDIDLAGTHIDVFSKEAFKWAVNDGHSFILVDMPPAVTAENPDATLADEQQAGLRPYWILYRKNQVINWRQAPAVGGFKLIQVTICEKVVEPDGEYGEEEFEQYRVLRPGSWQLYRKTKYEAGTAYTLMAEGSTSLDEIPLVQVPTDRDKPMMSAPPLIDLAHENLRHYRLQSDLDNILHYACVPLLVEDLGEATGAVDSVNPEGVNADREISPNTIYTVGKGGSLKYVEPTCTGVDKAQQEIATTKKNMATLGLLLLEGRPSVQQTATESSLDYEAETSELSGMARNLEDALEEALRFHAMYLGEADGGSVKVNRDFSRVSLPPEMINALANLVAADELPLEELWKKMVQAEILSPDFDLEQAQATLAEEQKKKQEQYPIPPAFRQRQRQDQTEQLPPGELVQ
jgi:hypothetical protein